MEKLHGILGPNAQPAALVDQLGEAIPDSRGHSTVAGCPQTSRTIGVLIESCMRLSSSRPETLDTYAKALRRIAAGVFRISDGGKHDAFNGGRAEWIEKINAIPLAELTPPRVLEWKNRFLRACRSPEARGRAAVTGNSLVRIAKALLSKKLRPFVEQELELPCPCFLKASPLSESPAYDNLRIIRCRILP